MCGIIGAVAQRDVAPILLAGLKHLEYRGYDSAGLAVVNESGLQRCRTVGKVSELARELQAHPLQGCLGIAHTRWATHGVPSERNAHPHVSRDDIAIVHNGIIENYEALRERLRQQGYQFVSETDSEITAHLIHQQLSEGHDLLTSVANAVKQLEGAFALGIIYRQQPDRLIAVRRGSPLVLGLGIGENFIASDAIALVPVTQQFIFLEDGDIAVVTRHTIDIFDVNSNKVERVAHKSEINHEMVSRGEFRHFMLKEIYEQPQAIHKTLETRVSPHGLIDSAFSSKLLNILAKVKRVQIIACGTSYHAGLVAQHWLESIVRIPTRVEVASEWRYRTPVVEADTLFVTISQSGETADTLAALRMAKQLGYTASLAICNVAESSLVREADCYLLTYAGPEIGVASTKAFTTQLINLLILTLLLGRHHGLKKADEIHYCCVLLTLPAILEQTLNLDKNLQELTKIFIDKQHSLFLGRGTHHAIALEGALKLKEISYIHAEAYPAGELKHGPLALIDANMPIIALAPNDKTLEKLKSNLHEVKARGGILIIFADHNVDFHQEENTLVINMPATDNTVSPIVYAIPLQLLAYHVAVAKGTDVDQPRNLAKSVTVE